MLNAVLGGNDLAQLPQFYVPYESELPAVVAHVKPMEDLKAANPRRVSDVDAIVNRFNQVPGGIGFVPVRGKVQDLSAIVERKSGAVLDVVDLIPWE